MKKALSALLILLLAAALVCGGILLLHRDAPAPSSAPAFPDEVPTITPHPEFFEIHYIDVGQADAALVLCCGHAMLIDGGNKADSSLIYSYLEKFDVTELDYIISTHEHEDHVGGLAGALNFASVKHAFSPVSEYDSVCFGNFKKYLDLQGVPITKPVPGAYFPLGCALVETLAPSHAGNGGNNESIVLKVSYGGTSFLFTGDAETEEELEMLESGRDLSCTVLKVAHHGSASSSGQEFLDAVSPEYAVISVGSGNSYGHPAQVVLDRLCAMGVQVLRTDLCGDIICRSDGSSLSFTTEHPMPSVEEVNTEGEEP